MQKKIIFRKDLVRNCTLGLSDAQINWLDAQLDENHLNRSQVIRGILDRLMQSEKTGKQENEPVMGKTMNTYSC